MFIVDTIELNAEKKEEYKKYCENPVVIISGCEEEFAQQERKNTCAYYHLVQQRVIVAIAPSDK